MSNSTSYKIKRTLEIGYGDKDSLLKALPWAWKHEENLKNLYLGLIGDHVPYAPITAYVGHEKVDVMTKLISEL